MAARLPLRVRAQLKNLGRQRTSLSADYLPPNLNLSCAFHRAQRRHLGCRVVAAVGPSPVSSFSPFPSHSTQYRYTTITRVIPSNQYHPIMLTHIPSLMYHSSASLRANNVSDSKDGEGKDLNPVKSKFGHINKKHICRTTAEAQMVEHTSDKTHDQQYKVGTSIDGHDSLNVNEENASRSISEATPKQDEKYTEMNRGRTLEEIMAADIEERNRNVENMKDALDANEHGTEDKNGHSNEEVIIDDDLASLAVEGEDIQYMPLDSNNEPVDMTNIMTKYTNDEIGIYMREMSAPAVGRSIGGVTIWSTDLRESDLHEKHIRGGGRGGQKINKTSNCVQLTHLPTGIVIKCQATRSLESNRKIARKVLSNKLDELVKGKESRAAIKRSKERRRKARKKRRNKKKQELKDAAVTDRISNIFSNSSPSGDA